jgi:hypothetical protein
MMSEYFIFHSLVRQIFRIEHHATGQTSHALINLFFFPARHPFFPLALPAVPPINRTYTLFPKEEVFWSNYVKWIHQEQVLLEAFVFLENEVLNGPAGFCPGMENAFLVRAKLHISPRGNNGWTSRLLICPSQFQSFPFEDCYSKWAWEIVLRLARLIFYELLPSSIIQRTQRSNCLDCPSGDWEYL